MTRDPRRAAQLRADQIRAFRAELARLQDEGACPLTPGQVRDVTEHHERVMAALARDFDVDRSAGAGELSRGLRLASLFGAGALVAAVTTLLQRVWDDLGLAAQVTLLCMFPLVALAGVQMAAERERTRYVASLFALVACGTAWVAIVMTPRVLNLPFSPLLLWPGVGFGVAVAMSYGFRAVFAASMAALAVATASVFFAAGGVPWTLLFERLEPLMLSAFVLAVLAPRVAEAGEGFESAMRLTGLTIGLGCLLVLSNVTGTSLLAVSPEAARTGHQAVILVVCLGIIAWRLRAFDPPAVRLAAACLAVFLLVRYVDWFWDALPAWAFFLVLAAAAFGSIAWLRRVRGRLEAR